MSERIEAPLHPVVRFLATGAYLGYSPIAPGTAGAFGCAVLLWFLVPEVTHRSSPTAISVYLVSVAAFFALSLWVAGVSERRFGRDASRIVIDEYCGFVFSVLLLPKSLPVFAAAFVLFRILDILKPFPARRAESLPGGYGIVMDDVVAGVYTNLLLRLMMSAVG